MNCKSGDGIWDNSGITFSFVLVPFNIRSCIIALKKPAFLRVCERKVVLDMVGVTGSIPVAPTTQFAAFGGFLLLLKSTAEIRRIPQQLLAMLVSDAEESALAPGNWLSFLWVKILFSLSDIEKLLEIGSNVVETK